MPSFAPSTNPAKPETQLGYLMTFLTPQQKLNLKEGIFRIIDAGIADRSIVCETRRDLAFERIWSNLLLYTVNQHDTFSLNGQVNYTYKRIRLAGRLLREDLHMPTLMHEIAHIIDHVFFKGRGHGYTWKLCDRALGGTGQRCSNRGESDEEIMKMPVVYRCPNGHLRGQSRRSSRPHSCGRCSKKYDERFMLKLIKG